MTFVYNRQYYSAIELHYMEIVMLYPSSYALLWWGYIQ
jgi:hypothetical protein